MSNVEKLKAHAREIFSKGVYASLTAEQREILIAQEVESNGRDYQGQFLGDKKQSEVVKKVVSVVSPELYNDFMDSVEQEMYAEVF